MLDISSADAQELDKIEAQIAARREALAAGWTPAVGDVVEHPKCGRGVVSHSHDGRANVVHSDGFVSIRFKADNLTFLGRLDDAVWPQDDELPFPSGAEVRIRAGEVHRFTSGTEALYPFPADEVLIFDPDGCGIASDGNVLVRWGSRHRYIDPSVLELVPDEPEIGPGDTVEVIPGVRTWWRGTFSPRRYHDETTGVLPDRPGRVSHVASDGDLCVEWSSEPTRWVASECVRLVVKANQ